MFDAKQHTRDYHDQLYRSHELFAPGSWLSAPNSKIRRAIDRVPEGAAVLDLGCGVGRHAIPAAQHPHVRSVLGVDFLPLAIEKLEANARRYGVRGKIEGLVVEIEAFSWPADAYDLVISFSAIEHVASASAFELCLRRLAESLKQDGEAVLAVMSDLVRTDTRRMPLPSGVEFDLTGVALSGVLEDVFHVIDLEVSPWCINESFCGSPTEFSGNMNHYRLKKS